MDKTVRVRARRVANPKGYIILTFKFHKEGRNWVGVCEELGTSTHHRSLPELQKQLEELSCLHLDTLEDVGETERYFKDNNIEFYEEKPKIGTVKIPLDYSSNVFVTSHLQRIPASPC